MTRLIDRLMDETRTLHQEAESEGALLLAGTSEATYRRFLVRWYGFIAPVERSLQDVIGLSRVFDLRRLRKTELIEHDLLTIGVRHLELKALPQCMSVPFCEDLCEAVGWTFLIERSTLSHPALFRQLAAELPGQVAFASSFLKCYFGAIGEMWRSYGEGLERAAAQTPGADEQILAAVRTSYRHFRRWRATLDGRTLSSAGDVVASQIGNT